MAEFLWTYVVQEAMKKLLKLADEQAGLAWGLEKELSNLTKWLLKAEAILRDINSKKLHHESVRMWVEELQHVVYEAEDRLDELVYEDLRRKVETEEKVRDFFSLSNDPCLFRSKMAKKLEDIAQTLCQHHHEASSLGVFGLVGEESIETYKNNDLKQIRETTLNLNVEFIGREVEVSNIVKLVIESSNNEQPMSIIPIVGMGGLGKTTLAKKIFNHELIKGHFDKTIWIRVSQPFRIINILEGIFRSLTKTSRGLNDKETLLRCLKEEMQGKKYFLVLDDVWNEDACLWNDLKECLKEFVGKSGNSIIVTTRSTKVATIMETISSHHLEKLSGDQCWSLFKESASVNGLLMNQELEIIREEFVTKIGGVPLVAKVLGGAVKYEGDYERWAASFKSIVKRIPKDDVDFVSSILKLSVDCLPLLSLKQCFAYCSNFPEDYLFDKESLIQMWIAQGFVRPREGDDAMMLEEDIGDRYFNFLLSRSLFEVVVYERKGITITHFTMHDLIHDIACDISNHQKVESSLGNSRSLFCINKESHGKSEYYGCLRVLVLDPICDEKYLSESLSMLKHLRYLDIIGRLKLKDLESITMLYNLQTLKLGMGLPLPKNLRKLVRLRHLRFDYNVLSKTPLHMSRLIHLQTLSAFEVDHEQGCKIEEVGPLKNLKGSLRLSNLRIVRSKEEAIGARLMEKKNLTSLDLDWNYPCGGEDNNYNGLEVLKGLQPHHSLQSISITCYTEQLFPNSIFVEKLVKILLRTCDKCEMLPMLGQLPNLEVLEISHLDSVRSIGREFYVDSSNQRVSFPKLKEFSLCSLQNLEKWEHLSNGIIAFPLLEVLSLRDCSKLKSVPNYFASLQTLQTLTIKGCRELTKLPNLQLEFCNSIKSLTISYCPRSDTLNMCNVHNLEHMKIIGCMEDYECLMSAELPQQLEHLATLKDFTIKNFQSMEALPDWLGNLTSLETLRLSSCNNLERLPSKEAMLRLKKLKHLYVRGCPMLLLDQDDPEEMSKLSHLPNDSGDLFGIMFKGRRGMAYHTHT